MRPTSEEETEFVLLIAPASCVCGPALADLDALAVFPLGAEERVDSQESVRHGIVSGSQSQSRRHDDEPVGRASRLTRTLGLPPSERS